MKALLQYLVWNPPVIGVVRVIRAAPFPGFAWRRIPPPQASRGFSISRILGTSTKGSAFISYSKVNHP